MLVMCLLTAKQKKTTEQFIYLHHKTVTEMQSNVHIKSLLFNEFETNEMKRIDAYNKGPQISFR